MSPTNSFPRAAGVLLHPTSLPGPNGIGDLGPEAYRFLDFMAAAGLSVWQMLPLGPTGYGDSPYQCYSAFAGNPLLVHIPGATMSPGAPPALATHASGPDAMAPDIDFGAVIPAKRAQLAAVFDRFVPDAAYDRFVAEHAWLEDYALFTAIKREHGGAAWTAWTPALAAREPAAIARFQTTHARAIAQARMEQYYFFAQFAALRRACRERGIRLMGDVPIYVAHDSADVWANRELFQLDADGALLVQAGVPPDYFSATGQLWGNPLYRWDVLAADGYRWWIARMRAAFAQFDIVRLDHFRGFEAYWEVPGYAATAEHGRWVPGPGLALFDAIHAALGRRAIVAENLGLITPAVEALRERLGFPGMSILQFAFGGGDDGREFRPHNLPRHGVLYTGTHDNDTTRGWWEADAASGSTRAPDAVARERAFARQYLDTDGTAMSWTLARAALASVSDTVLLPMQDLLDLGSAARMNEPGRQAGNWRFRFRWAQVTPALVRRLRETTTLFDR